MDFGKFRTGDWLLVASGAVMLVFGMALDWVSADTIIGRVSGGNPFDFFFTGGLAYLLVVAAGVVTLLLAGGLLRPEQAPWPVVLVAGTGSATLLMVLRLLLGSGFDGVGRGPGMYVAVLAAAVALAGAVMNFTATGGTFKDLTDVDKLRGSFQGRGGGIAPPPPPPPPPPPGGSTPPPPPPPPSV